MKNVGHDTGKDVAVGKLRPEGLVDGSELLSREKNGILAVPVFFERLECFLDIARGAFKLLATLLGRYSATGAAVFFATADEALLRIIGNVRRKECAHASQSPTWV